MLLSLFVSNEGSANQVRATGQIENSLKDIRRFKENFDFYKEGIKYKKNGDWFKALEIWWDAKVLLTEKEQYDPKIGIAFIELVTELGKTEHYETASKLYYWGLSHYSAFDHKAAIEKEIERLKPLLEKEQYQLWKEYLKLEDPSLLSEIRGFWIQKDPTPTTLANERLIEHWERIAFARKNYVRGSYTVYGTDDRGLIYVKYGHPSRKKSGFLGSNSSQIRMWIDEIIDEVDREDIQFNQTLEQAKAEWNSKQEIIRTLVMTNPHPEYEAWVYTSLNADDPPVYLFGRKYAMGNFKLLDGIEDFIPNREFSITTLKSGISPGSIFQLVYYSDLFILGGIFEQRYHELESIWRQSFNRDRIPQLSAIRGVRNKYQSDDKNDFVKLNAPTDQSSLTANIKPIRLDCFQTRFVHENNKPVISIIAFAIPQIYSIENLGQILNDESAYDLKNTLMLYDKNWNEIQRVSDYPPAGFDNTSVYFIEQSKFIEHVEIVAEAYSQDQVAVGSTDKYFSSDAIAIGKIILDKKPPLSTNPDSLEISDLLVGELPAIELDTLRYPFPVIPRSTIPNTSPLQLFYELYHLSLGTDKKASYTVQYQVEKQAKRSIIGRLFRRSDKKQVVSLISDYDADSTSVKETIGFDISKVEPGRYDFVVEVTDNNSNQKKSRKTSFLITE